LANEAYRAVFIRIHPTGKGVLSLTTVSDGQEAKYAEIVSNELGVPALDIKVVPNDFDRYGEGHGFNQAPSGGTAQAVVAACGKIKDKAQLLAGMALGAPPSNLRWDNGAWINGRDAKQGKTMEEIALYAFGSGALPPGVEGGLDAQAVYSN